MGHISGSPGIYMHFGIAWASFCLKRLTFLGGGRAKQHIILFAAQPAIVFPLKVLTNVDRDTSNEVSQIYEQPENISEPPSKNLHRFKHSCIASLLSEKKIHIIRPSNHYSLQQTSEQAAH